MGATTHLQHACLVQTLGKGGLWGAWVLALKGMQTRRCVGLPVAVFLLCQKMVLSSFAAGCSCLQCEDVEQGVTRLEVMTCRATGEHILTDRSTAGTQ